MKLQAVYQQRASSSYFISNYNYNYTFGSSESFKTYQTERVHIEKISERSGQIQSSIMIGREMPFFQNMSVVNHPATIFYHAFFSQ